MPDEMDPERRRFVGAAAITLAATQLEVASLAVAQTGTTPAAAPARRSGMSNAFEGAAG